MKCPFCQEELYQEGRDLMTGRTILHLSCTSITCMVNNDFPRYRCSMMDNRMYTQEYSLGNFYVKVDEYRTRIYQLKVCLLRSEVKVLRPLWLNFTNFDQTLDKLKLMTIFS